ncbi:MAG: protein kinase [Acidobacteria bacterium]|nr:protein kinase [Acidobacteriota bacterium]
MLSTNQILRNRYRITAQLGQIDAGLGYAAFDNTAGKNVMLKESQLEGASSEIRAVPATVRHQSLLCATDSFNESGRRYLVMDHADGKTLGELLEKTKNAFPVKEVSFWADGLLDALHHLHTQVPPIIHSDIKPQNIKLSSGGNVKLFVFGVSPSGEHADETETMSFDAAILGYLPIEQIWLGLDVGSRKVIRSGYDEQSAEILELPLDVQSDIYSIGATIYHLLTGRVPADALTRSIDLLEGKPDPLVPATKLNPAVPSEVSDILTRAMKIRREERYGSASIMRQVLRAAFARIKADANPSPSDDFGDDDAVLELPASIPAPAPKPVSPIPPGMRSGESQQIEIIKRQLREAEARRLEAERRAADAEQRLLERDTVDFKLADIPVEVIDEPAPEPVPESFATPHAPTVESAEPFAGMIEEAERAGGHSMAKVAGAAALLLVVGASGWGIWTFVAETPAGPVPMKVEAPAASLPKPEANPVADSPVVTTSEDFKPQPVAATAATPDAPADDPSIKAKPTQTPPQQAKKQPTPTPKTDKPQKKSVTLDDLLKDN